MKPALASGVLSLVLLGVGFTAHAATTSLTSGLVNIDYDPDSFSFSHDDAFLGVVDILPSSVTITGVGNGLTLNFNDQMALDASSYSNFTPQSLSGSFNALFNFTPTAGYVVTSYTVTYAGTYNIETPGSVSIFGPGGGLTQYSGGGGFSSSGVVAGAAAPQLLGSVSATGDIAYVQVFDHYDSVFDHYESVLDYCDADNPEICHYHDEAVYRDEPVYRDEMDLGEAILNLQTISLQANVAAVPEPEALALLAVGLPLLAGLAYRKRRIAAS